jgi:hypothetical protein
MLIDREKHIGAYLHEKTDRALWQLLDTTSLPGQDMVHASALSHAGGGSYTFSVLVTKAGTYLVAVLIDSSHVTGTPARVSVTVAGASPAASVAEGAGVVSGLVGVQMPIRVRVADAYGNALAYGASIGAVTVNIVFVNGDRSMLTLQQDAAYGEAVYTTLIRETAQGNLAVSIQIAGVPMAGSTFVSACALVPCLYMSLTLGSLCRVVMLLRRWRQIGHVLEWSG